MRFRIFGVDERKGNERPAVFLPRGQDGKLAQVGRTVNHFSNWGSTCSAGSEFKQVPRNRAMLPKFSAAWRQQGFGDFREVANERLRLWPKGEFDALSCAEEIGDNRIVAAFNAFEEERRPPLLDYAPMNLGRLKVRIDFGFNCDDVFFAREEVEECAQVSMHPNEEYSRIQSLTVPCPTSNVQRLCLMASSQSQRSWHRNELWALDVGLWTLIFDSN